MLQTPIQEWIAVRYGASLSLTLALLELELSGPAADRGEKKRAAPEAAKINQYCSPSNCTGTLTPLLYSSFESWLLAHRHHTVPPY